MIRFKRALLERGIGLGDLGVKLGVARRSMIRSSHEFFEDSLALRWRIEAFFGYSEAIWSSRDILAIRSGCHRTFGLDPFLCEKPDLLALAKKAGVSLANVPRTVLGYREAIVCHLAVNRHLLTPRLS